MGWTSRQRCSRVGGIGVRLRAGQEGIVDDVGLIRTVGDGFCTAVADLTAEHGCCQLLSQRIGKAAPGSQKLLRDASELAIADLRHHQYPSCSIRSHTPSPIAR